MSVTPDQSCDEDRGLTVKATACLSACVATLVVVVRLCTAKFVVGHVGWDDWITLVALVRFAFAR